MSEPEVTVVWNADGSRVETHHGDDTVVQRINRGRPKLHIRYHTSAGSQSVHNVGEWFEWMQEALTLERQVKAIKDVLAYRGGTHIVAHPSFVRWCVKNNAAIVNPTPEVARILNRRAHHAD